MERTAQIISGRFDNCHGDEDYREASLADQLKESRRAIQLRDELLASDDWWRLELSGVNPVSKAVDDQLSRIMGPLDSACKEIGPTGHYATQGILSALSIIQREAQMEAKIQAEGMVRADNNRID